MKKSQLLKKAGAVSLAGVLLLSGCQKTTPTDVSQAETKTETETVTETESEAAEGEAASYTSEERSDGKTSYVIVTNPNDGAILGYSTSGQIQLLELEEDGVVYAFKDMNGNGQIDNWEDWRNDAETRAKELVKELEIEEIAGLMLFSSHEREMSAGLTDEQKDYLENSNLRNVLNAGGNNATDAVLWVNEMQAYVESLDFKVPVNFSSDPRSTAGRGDIYSDMVEGSEISKWPSNLGLAATFSTDTMYQFAKMSSQEYRAMGITTALGPQVDLASDPRWLRNGGTFGEGTKLATDMTQAYVDGSQSTYGESGEDLGWGSDSINCMIKHWVGEGAGEGGREGHSFAGKYAIYPGDNFDEHLQTFTEGGFKLNGKTKSSSAVMSSYTIGIDKDGNGIGGTDKMGSAYNQYKMDLLRNTYNFDGVVCTDWGVTKDTTKVMAPMTMESMGTGWGAEDLSDVERHKLAIEYGTDMFGGNNESAPIMEAYKLMVEEHGEEAARERLEKSGERILRMIFLPGIFENPYLDLETSLAVVGSADKVEAGYQTQLDSVVLLKNEGEVIKDAENAVKKPKDMTVYIPMTFKNASSNLFGTTEEAWFDSLEVESAKEIFGTVLTDTPVEDADGKVTGVTAPDLSECDLVIVGMSSPDNGSQFSGPGGDTETGTFYPLSIQYRPYTADGEHVRQNAIVSDEGEERSYYGKTSYIYNEYDLDACLNAVEAVKQSGKEIPVVAFVNSQGSFLVHEFEEQVDAILVGYSVSDKAALEVIAGLAEPKGLLPMQIPANMDAVEAQLEDIPSDAAVYTDRQGNAYDFAYGMNWSGVIQDERTEKYGK